MSEVASFYFTRLPDSYAARTDRPGPRRRDRRRGVPRVAATASAAATVTPPLSKRDANAHEAESRAQPTRPAPPRHPRRKAPPRRRPLAAGFSSGRRRSAPGTASASGRTSCTRNFRRATSHPAETLTIYYDTRANLVARGVIPGTDAGVDAEPVPRRAVRARPAVVERLRRRAAPSAQATCSRTSADGSSARARSAATTRGRSSARCPARPRGCATSARSRCGGSRCRRAARGTPLRSTRRARRARASSRPLRTRSPARRSAARTCSTGRRAGSRRSRRRGCR